MSILDTLSGFLRNESDSEEEDPHLLKVVFRQLVQVRTHNIERNPRLLQLLQYKRSVGSCRLAQDRSHGELSGHSERSAGSH